MQRPQPRPFVRACVGVVLCACVLGGRGRADAGIPLESAVAQAGRDYYMRYCASCHGYDAKGLGPVAPALVTKPPDLTLIAERRKGDFAMDEIAKLIDGRELPAAHGTREMPVWGERFGRDFESGEMREQVIRGQLLMLLVYLQSIQR